MTNPANNSMQPFTPPVRDDPMYLAAASVVRRLQSEGHAAMLAGGCVRDMLMGETPSDYDVATSAPPQEVTRIYRRARQVGVQFGVVLVRAEGFQFEVATFRRDLDYHDGRRPSAVAFTDAREDALRRDFTINGMFYDPAKQEIVDYVGGKEDLTRRVIRAIGEPERRFREDHLRLMRAIRFAARLDFSIEPATWAALVAHAPEIVRISPERVREELEAMLTHPRRASAFAQLVDSELLLYLWSRAQDTFSRAESIRRVLAALPGDASFPLALATFFLGAYPDDAAASCEALRCSNETKRIVTWLIANEAALDDPAAVTSADLKLLMANPAFEDLLRLLAARLMARDLPPAAWETVSRRAAAIPPQDVAPPPLLTGHDLAAWGIPQGPLYREVLDRVYYSQLNGELTDAAAAQALARRLLKEKGANEV